MTGRDLVALTEDMTKRGLLDQDICCFDYDDAQEHLKYLTNYLTVYTIDPDVMVEYTWTGTKFTYREFNSETGEAL